MASVEQLENAIKNINSNIASVATNINSNIASVATNINSNIASVATNINSNIVDVGTNLQSQITENQTDLSVLSLQQKKVSPFLRKGEMISAEQYLEYIKESVPPGAPKTITSLKDIAKYPKLTTEDIIGEFLKPENAIYSYPDGLKNKMFSSFQLFTDAGFTKVLDFTTTPPTSMGTDIISPTNLIVIGLFKETPTVKINKHPSDVDFTTPLTRNHYELMQTLGSQKPLTTYFMQNPTSKDIKKYKSMGVYPIVNSMWKEGMVWNGTTFETAPVGVSGTVIMRSALDGNLNFGLPEGQFAYMDGFVVGVLDTNYNFLIKYQYILVNYTFNPLYYDSYSDPLKAISSPMYTKFTIYYPNIMTVSDDLLPTYEKWEFNNQMQPILNKKYNRFDGYQLYQWHMAGLTSEEAVKMETLYGSGKYLSTFLEASSIPGTKTISKPLYYPDQLLKKNNADGTFDFLVYAIFDNKEHYDTWLSNVYAAFFDQTPLPEELQKAKEFCGEVCFTKNFFELVVPQSFIYSYQSPAFKEQNGGYVLKFYIKNNQYMPEAIKTTLDELIEQNSLADCSYNLASNYLEELYGTFTFSNTVSTDIINKVKKYLDDNEFVTDLFDEVKYIA